MTPITTQFTRPSSRPPHIVFRPMVGKTITTRVRESVAVLTATERAEVMAPVRAAIKALQFGGFDDDHWRNLADAYNIGEALCGLNICNDHAAEFEAAQQALYALSERWRDHKSRAARGAELLAIQDAAVIYDIQLRYASAGELRAAVHKVHQVVSQALAGNAGAALVVDPGQGVRHG